jgi:diphthamide biosynthesis protein 7
LDVQWAPHADKVGDLLAVATSTGQLVFYRLDARGDGDLVLSSTKLVSDPSTLVLSLAWHPWRAHVLGFTLSDGSVCLCESTEGELWSEESILYQTTIHRHDLESWTLAFSGPNSTNVLSGGDDCILQYSTINSFNEREVQWQDRKLHTAGVTAILPLTSNLVVTGSYDDNIRLISFPQSGRRQVLAEANLGGGVWWLKALSTTTLPAREGDEPEITRYVLPSSTSPHEKQMSLMSFHHATTFQFLSGARVRGRDLLY